MRRKIAALASTGLLAGLLAAAPVSTTAAAQEVGDVTVVPLQVTGPPSERLT
jgi:hypothetical protein